MDALSDRERQQAMIGHDLPGELLTAALQDNRRIEPAGIRYPDLPGEGRERLEALLGVYTGRIRPGQAEVRWAEVKRHLDARIGPVDDHSPFYYRILSPVILAEFDHQSGIIYDNDEAVARPHPYRRAHAQRQRLWPRSAAPALRPARPHRVGARDRHAASPPPPRLTARFS